MFSNISAFGRILLIDDNVDLAQLMQLVLTSLGYAVEIAHTGKDGLALAKSFLPQVVFLDIGMPGMSGYEVAVELRATPQVNDVFLLALTGWSDRDTRAAVVDAGFDRHLVKPPKLDVITSILDEYFSTKAEQMALSNHATAEV
jgi:DNA-binding response OmpR family regulator